MRKKFTNLISLSFIFYLLTIISAFGQLEIEWQKNYGGSRGESIRNTYSLPDGKVLLVGVSDSENALSGTYTIGGDTPDFEHFTTALAALENYGVTGPVTFKVRPGTYDEQLQIKPIPGSSCSNVILFEGEGAAPAQVILQSPADSILAVQVNGVDGIGFRNISIVNGVEVDPGSDCFSLENNILAGSIQARSSTISRNNQHLYRNNIFQRGAIIIESQSTWNPEAPVFDQGLIIEGNEFRHTGPAISISDQQGFTINNNLINNLRGGGVGIAVNNSWYGHEISGNIISGAASQGMSLNSAAASRITENQISFSDGGVGMTLSTGKSRGDEMLVANNLIAVDGYDARGMYYSPIGNLVGMDIDNQYENELKLYHNTIHITGYSVDVPNYALSIRGKNRSFHVFNNVMVNFASGKELIVRDNQAIAAMDYNNFTSYFSAIWGIQEINSLADWQRITGYDEHSVAANPGSPQSPAETIIGAGIYLNEVPQDVFGQERNDPPTIGAVEREVIQTPLSGTYTIGGEDPDFASFTEAVAALTHSGIADSILFKVRPGAYYEQLNLVELTDRNTRITFEGESGDSTAVALIYPLDEVLVLRSMSNVAFRHMSFEGGISIRNSSGLQFESNVIKGGVDAFMVSNDVYRNNLFQEAGISKSGQGLQVQGGRSFFTRDYELLIEGNTFVVAGSAISLFAQAEVTINNNDITITKDENDYSGGGAISIEDSEAIKEIKHNTIVSYYPNGTGMRFEGEYFSGGLPEELTHNSIELMSGGTGMSFYYLGATSAPSLVANNIISIKGDTSRSTGIAIAYSPGMFNIYHNSILLHGADSNSRIMFFGDEIFHDINLKNNIFANLAGGVVFEGEYFNYSPDKIASSDYNNLYTSGAILAEWEEGLIASLSEWQSRTGFDAHSLSVDPGFTSTGSLVPTNQALDGAGIALEAVTTDYFGQLRNDPPDPGAVEFDGATDPETPVRPEPTIGFVVGGAVFHSPAGAITKDPRAEGLAILSFHADQKKKENSPKGIASLTIPRAGFRFESVNAYEWISVNEKEAILQGTGQLNREDGYRFVISVVDNGTGAQLPKDTYRMIIWDPEGEVVYDNQRGSEIYATATMAIDRGDIQVRQAAGANARLSTVPEATAFTEFKAYPTQLEQEALWLEIPSMEGADQLQLSILDRQGRVMVESTVSTAGKHQLRLKTAHWSPGIYLLVIRGKQQLYQQKLVK